MPADRLHPEDQAGLVLVADDVADAIAGVRRLQLSLAGLAEQLDRHGDVERRGAVLAAQNRMAPVWTLLLTADAALSLALDDQVLDDPVGPDEDWSAPKLCQSTAPHSHGSVRCQLYDGAEHGSLHIAGSKLW